MHISMHQHYKFASEIIRAYDIRGVFGENLNEEDALFLALKLLQARSKMELKGKVCIGYDGRTSSPALYKAFLKGLMTEDIKITDLGLVPTPVLYFAANYLPDIDVAVMITGSHNPANHNGFKVMLNGKALFGQDLKDLANLEVVNYQSHRAQAEVIRFDIETAYLTVLQELISINNNLRIVWDPGNGAACNILKQLITYLPSNHLIINGEVDGRFPAHHPDPSRTENLQQLIRKVKEEGYDFGIAFDGDADRLGIVDKRGQILFGSHLLYIFAFDLLKRNPGATILTDMKMSALIMNTLKKLNCNLIQYKTGHALIKAKMKEVNSMLAAEMSGHIFFAESYYGFDDAIFGACKFLEIAYHDPALIERSLQITKSALSVPERKINANELQKEKFINAVRSFLRQTNYQFSEIDGIRVDREGGWWLIRASNTENLILFTGEAYTEGAASEINKIFDKLLSVGSSVAGINYPNSF
ncbi:MAG: phosphomannomutase/phosphoglucomutase [Candidatus Midichloria sp.]|nr:MAG: phosphomannomutase/phosphoglucomutase [Candidatus Midichloria sp.]